MEPTQNLFYALGEFAYSIAMADGKIQKEEKQALHNLLAEEFKDDGQEYDYSEIIFEILRKDEIENVQTAYNLALKEIKINSHYLSPDLKEKFLRVIQKVADAFPPRTADESAIIEKFKKDICVLKGDPVYYKPRQIGAK